MVLPVCRKTWQFDVNNTVVASTLATTAAGVIYGIKRAMCSFASSPWTVVASSDSVSAGAADYWIDATDVVWAAGPAAHSWIVLEQAGMIGGAFQVMFSCSNANPYNLGVTISPDGSFGAPWATTVDPTATYQIVVSAATANWGLYSAAMTTIYHVMQSTDGTSTRILFCREGGATGRMEFADVLNQIPDSGTWTDAVMALKYGTYLASQDYVSYANENVSTGAWFASYNGSAINMIPASLATGVGADALVGEMFGLDELTLEYNAYPVGVFSLTAGSRGYRGEVADLWYAPNMLWTGDSFPDDASRQFANFGMLLVPWNGTVPVIA